MKNYKVNFDFEMLLSNPKLRPSAKINSEFEYVFFFINKEEASLNNYFKYDSLYLDSLKKYGIKVPDFKDEESLDWWGDLSLENSKVLNSKVFSTRLALEDNILDSSFKIASSYNQIKNYINENENYLLRSDLGFSGKGHLKLNRELDINKVEKFFNKNGESIFSPYCERVLDIGVTIDLNTGHFFIVENFNHPSGSFRGGRYFKSIEDLKDEYDFVDVSHLEKSILWNKEKSICAGAKNFMQVDMFYYQKDSEIKLCAHVEWNYRKTMGMMLSSLSEIMSKKYVSWLIIPSKLLKKDLSKTIYSNVDEAVVITSPIDGHYFFSFAIGADTKAIYNQKLSQTLDLLGVSDDFTKVCASIKS